MNRKAVIFGIKGYALSRNEKALFKKEKPWGIILFSRNIRDMNQLKKLIDNIRNIHKDKKYPILIDEEGGKVSRLKNIIDFSLFPPNYFTKLYLKDRKNFLNYYKIYINTVSSILNDVGVNINTVPVLDVRSKKGHKIIGDRAFSYNPAVVSKLGNLCINLYKDNKIATVMKHIPGHGLSTYDSHYKTPIINESKENLKRKDFSPFKNCKSFFAMTSHIIYKNFDSMNTATHSKIVINKVIRNYIKFNGLLISDDISMKSLKLGLKNNANKALESGCNLVLHCNGNIKEMRTLARLMPKIDKFTVKKTSQFYNFLG